ncbi:MAG: ClC family H(+)/Cl(-) exchange transporter [Actinomyces sp.]|jgi:H+/Cl- antiporter ClcA|nr:ClC family H(+)/Cl(-) exchange transporter [Actinomyces sp.]MCI1787425.1 ClC family H(+)/Cl(-) exchange transporter [Actinomyces sp.]MCI1830757.1 ClC family H(+)/Cl(-) exchange transporter [Actinomyces sp.]MCI1867451.1 ClC family H(+)/Cl(-) exchange transporter [Actinomyces sp.]
MANGWRSLMERMGHLFASRRWRVARNGVLAGLLAGSASVAYRWMIAHGTAIAHLAYQTIGRRPLWMLAWTASALLVAVAVRQILRWEPTSSGSGIPQVKGILQHRMALRPLHVLAARFCGGAGGALFGLSLGREGPSIHIGAAAADLLARPMGATPQERDQLITSGAAAGLSAAFNAPVSGMVFGIEGLHRNFSPLVVVSASTGALAADVVSTLAFGTRPILQFGASAGSLSGAGAATPGEIPLSQLWVVLPLGILAGLVGALMNRALLGAQALSRLPGPLPVLVALAAALPCGLWAPRVLGGGEDLIEWAEVGSIGLGAVLVALAAKLALTTVSFGSGVPGGIFMPILAIGTLTGAGYALGAQALGLSGDLRMALAVCGMAGVLAASVRTPLTSILLTAEMTGTLGRLLPVATVVIMSIFTADALRVPPIYDALLQRSLSGGSPAPAPSSRD